LSRECTLVNTWKPSRMNYFEGWEDQQSESFFLSFILVVWLWYNARENDLKLRIFFYCYPIFSARHSIFFQRS
jgi:3-methyladenine DNA glycosylase AlkD